MTRAFIFPGQGSQFTGMGRDLSEAFPAARLTFEEVDDALNQNLSGLMFGGPESDLNLTENTQPALMAVSMAVVNVLAGEAGIDLAARGAFFAGHSLGEYSALTAAGSFALADAARLLRLRGRSMQQAVPVGEGAMAAILGLDYDAVAAIAEAAAAEGVCEAANDNAPGQVVISGARAAVDAAIALAAERGAKRALPLPVSDPFHCALMEPAARAMEAALGQAVIRPPSLPVIANVTADAVSDPAAIRDLLVRQVTGRVRWRESVQRMKALGIDETLEIGAGKVLTGLVKRIEPDMKTGAAGTPEQVEALIKALQ